MTPQTLYSSAALGYKTLVSTASLEGDVVPVVFFGPIAQSVEQLTHNQPVPGSSPGGPSVLNWLCAKELPKKTSQSSQPQIGVGSCQRKSARRSRHYAGRSTFGMVASTVF